MFFKKIGFWGILGPPSYGIGATIRIGREIQCLPYAGFFLVKTAFMMMPIDARNIERIALCVSF